MTGQKFFTIGLVLVLLGLQLRAVETYVLNQKASEFVEKRMRQSPIQSENAYDSLLLLTMPAPRKQFSPPRWIGMALISVGAVLLLHGLTSHKK